MEKLSDARQQKMRMVEPKTITNKVIIFLFKDGQLIRFSNMIFKDNNKRMCSTLHPGITKILQIIYHVAIFWSLAWKLELHFGWQSEEVL